MLRKGARIVPFVFVSFLFCSVQFVSAPRTVSGGNTPNGESQSSPAVGNDVRVVVEHSNLRSTAFRVSLPGVEVRRGVSGGEAVDRVVLPGENVTTRRDELALPTIRRLIAVPECESINVQTIVKSERVFQNFKVGPLSEPQDGIFGRERGELQTPDKAAASSVGDDPLKDIVRIESIGYLRGQRIAVVAIWPYNYDAKHKSLKVFENLEIGLEYTASSGEIVKDTGPAHHLMTHHVLNYSGGEAVSMAAPGDGAVRTTGIGQVCWCSGSDWRSAAQSAVSCGVDYLIIMSDELQDTLVEKLAEKRADFNGFNVAIAKISQIDSDPDTIDTPDTLRSFIKEIYDSRSAVHMSDSLLGYVLLLGDAYAPDGTVLIPSYYGFPYGEPSDAYYSFLSDSSATNDLFADLFIGRIPVDASSHSDPPDPDWELRNVVEKIRTYSHSSMGTSDVLMVSGGDQTGLPPFGPLFSYIIDSYLPAFVNTDVLHRTDYPSFTDSQFSAMVADSINVDKYWLLGLFDHGSVYYLVDSFFPRHYDTLSNNSDLPLALLLASDTGWFDLEPVNPKDYCCLHTAPGTSLGCYTPVVTMDSCDVMAERLLVQEHGAIGVITYSRSQRQWEGGGVYAAYFRSIFEDNSYTLGEILLSTRMYQGAEFANNTARSLTLFGDPALNIMWEGGVAEGDTVDLAVKYGDIKFSEALRNRYVSSSVDVGMEVTLRNQWNTDAGEVAFEIWDGHPDSLNSVSLMRDTVTSIVKYGTASQTLNIGTLSEGLHDIYVVIDSTTHTETTLRNNMAHRTLSVLDYENGYPVDVGLPAFHAITIADVAPNRPGKELLLNLSRELRCYGMSGELLWSHSACENGDDAGFINGTPVVGNVYKDGIPYCLYLDSLLYVLDGATGESVDTVFVGSDNYYPVGGASYRMGGGQTLCLSDVVSNDDALELIVRVSRLVGVLQPPTGLYVRCYRLDGDQGTLQWERKLGSVYQFDQRCQFGVGDIDGDGDQDITVKTTSTEPSSPPDSLYAVGASGELLWSGQTSDGSDPYGYHPLVMMSQPESDSTWARMSVATVGVSQSEGVKVYAFDHAGSQQVWDFSSEAGAEPYISAGDVDADGDVELVAVSGDELCVMSTSGVKEHSTSLKGTLIASPLIADIDDDGTMEIITLARYCPLTSYYECYHIISVLQSDLSMSTEFAFPYDQNDLKDIYDRFTVAAAGTPAIDDIDGDGLYELAFASIDSVLHVVELGTGVGRADWAQKFNNPMQTSNLAQPVVGEYTNDVTLFNRSRVLGDVVFDGDVFVDAAALVLVSGTDAASSGRDSTRCEVDFNGAVRMIGSESSPVVFRPETPQGGGVEPWWGISVSSSSQSNLIKHCVIEDAETGLTLSDWPYTYGYVSNVDILDSWIGLKSTIPFSALEDVTATRCGIGFYSASGNQTYRNITAVDCGRGFDNPVGSATVDSSTFADCDTALMTWDTLTLKNSEVRNSQLYGVWAKGGDFHMSHTIVKDKTGSPTPTAVRIDSTVATAAIDTCQISDAITGILAKTQTVLTKSSISNCTTGFGAPWTPQMTLDHCAISFNQTGISASGPIKLNFSRVTKSGTGTGATAISAPTAEIRSSYLDATLAAVSIDSGLIYTDTLNSDGYGLVMAGPVTCRQSRILSVGSNFYGINASDAASDLVLRGTLVSGYDIGVYLGQGTVADIDSGCTFSGNDAGIHAYASSDVGIRASTFDGNTTNGVSLNASYAVIEGNTITGSTNGIFLYASDGAIQEKNVIEENGSGVKCDEESAPTIHENKIASNSTGITALNDANPDIGVCCDEEGEECDTTGTCAGEGRNNISGNTNYHVVNLSPSITIAAECNYWGSRGPLPSKFSGAVDRNPYLGTNPLPDLVAGGPPGSMPNTVDALPTKYDIGQNYPNPFNPVTTIRYQVPRPGGPVQLIVYDVRGGVVRTLVNQAKEPGYYTLNWDGRNDRGTSVASGVYFLRMAAPGFVKTQKLVVIK